MSPSASMAPIWRHCQRTNRTVLTVVGNRCAPPLARGGSSTLLAQVHAKGAPMADLLVETKLLVPQPRREVVARPRLVDVVRRSASRAALTLVSAPAGFGKTTLLAAVVSQ